MVKKAQKQKSVTVTDLAARHASQGKRTYLKKLVGSILMLPILVYFGFIGYVYFFPELVFYNPDTTKPNLIYAKSVIPTLHEVSYKTEDGRDIYAWYATPKNPQKAVIFFHGNSYNIYYHIPRVLPFLRSGYTVILPEYEGFGGIEGTPSQRNMEDNMRATIKFLNDKGVQNKDIVLYGHSLGTYMATYVAAKLAGDEKFDALILESPFTSLTDVADIASYGLFPVKVVVRDKYNSYDLIDKIGTRLMIAHGTDDPTVPYELGVKLFEKATGHKRFYGVKGANHRNLPENGFLDEALKWLGYPRAVYAQPVQADAAGRYSVNLNNSPKNTSQKTQSLRAVTSQSPTRHSGVPFNANSSYDAPIPQVVSDTVSDKGTAVNNDNPHEVPQNRSENLDSTNPVNEADLPKVHPAHDLTQFPGNTNLSTEVDLETKDTEKALDAARIKAFEKGVTRAEFGQNRPIKTMNEND